MLTLYKRSRKGLTDEASAKGSVNRAFSYIESASATDQQVDADTCMENPLKLLDLLNYFMLLNCE